MVGTSRRTTTFRSEVQCVITPSPLPPGTPSAKIRGGNKKGKEREGEEEEKSHRSD